MSLSTCCGRSGVTVSSPAAAALRSVTSVSSSHPVRSAVIHAARSLKYNHFQSVSLQQRITGSVILPVGGSSLFTVQKQLDDLDETGSYFM